MHFWRYLSAGLLVVIIIGIIIHSMDMHTGSSLTRNCFVINDLTLEDLTSNVVAMYLVTAKLFPIVNTRYATHWSVVIETKRGYYNISTARYMSIYIYPIKRDGAYYFIGSKWENKLYTLKRYALNGEYRDKGLTLYDVAQAAMRYYNRDDKSKYGMMSHNCQHVAQYIISTFGDISNDDPLMRCRKGFELFKASIADAIYGPKIII